METKQIIDPPILTTQQLWREIAALKELLLTKSESIDKAVGVAHQDLVRVPTEVQRAVAAAKDVIDEKFVSVNTKFDSLDKFREDLAALINEKLAGVQKQFEERDIRVEQSARQTETAVNAALTAAEKAVGKQNESFTVSINKSEAATMKQIDQQAALIGSATKSLDDKITDVKDRLTRIEGQGSGKNALWVIIIAAIAALASIISIIAVIFQFAKK